MCTFFDSLFVTHSIMYTYDMRRNKHNIQTYYRTRLFWLKNDNNNENKQFVITKHFVTDLLKKKGEKTRYKKKEKKQEKKERKIVSQVDSLHDIG